MEGLKLFLFRVFLLSLLCFLCACSNTKHLNTTIQSENFLNPNIYNKSSPVVITIFQLKSPSQFERTNFFALYNNSKSALGNDLLDKREIEIQPKQKKIVSIELTPHTNYIGIFAAFRNLNHARWRQLIKIKSGSNIYLKINLEKRTLTAHKE